jgi:hypothetical protein
MNSRIQLGWSGHARAYTISPSTPPRVLDDPLDVRIVADVFGRPPAGDDYRDVVGRIDVGEGHVRRPAVARLPGVHVVAIDEVVHHELELLPSGAVAVYA